MQRSLPLAFLDNFLGSAPGWYKLTIIAFLLINPIILYMFGPFVAGWIIVVEFIFTLAMALKCYPLQPGGLIAIEVLIMGLTTAHHVGMEIASQLEVILLLIFMVAGIYFMKNLLLFAFTKILLGVRSKIILSLLFSAMAAFLSAFLDALTVTAVIISVITGFYGVYHKVASGRKPHHDHDHSSDENVETSHKEDLRQFRSFLRSILMHASVGTALGGVCTLVGEPQNLVIAGVAGWDFAEFFFRMSPVTMPVLVVGLSTCAILEKTGKFGYGAKIPESVRAIIEEDAAKKLEERTTRDVAELIVQAAVGIFLILGLLNQWAEVGLIGLAVIVLITAFTGIVEEHQLGKAFEEALPFTALLAVFFAIVAMIAEQGLFGPVIHWVLQLEGSNQTGMFYIANGLLSMISDNVFVGTVYIKEIDLALRNGVISRDTFDQLAVAINTGTNIPSIATPNGQAAFLFLLTSTLAPLVRLSYMKMVKMALPYTITMSITGFFFVFYYLQPMTDKMYENNIIHHHVEQPADVDGHGKKKSGH
ncbi:MAG: sodium/proton antiporter NhaB [Gammaproteobacteria bacterium]|nr:MAG: sodium/proton antiporter NhaB [Gammaproteobacteria bacterium]